MAMLGEADRSRVAALEGIKALPGDPLARAESLLLGAELEAALGQEYRARLQAELAAGWLEVARLRAQQLIPARTAPLASPQVHSRSQT
jgi:hypothetical protein